MYSENWQKDILSVGKAVATNSIAKFFPGWYWGRKLDGLTGRGDAGEEVTTQIADYYRECFAEYEARLAAIDGAALAGRRALEYGPGDTLGVALLMYAHGAENVTCVDRFPLQRANSITQAVYQNLIDGMDASAAERARGAFSTNGDVSSAFRSDAIDYRVTPSGLSGHREAFDFIYSRSVLEHVNDLPSTIRDIAGALSKQGVSIHKVDLKSHGLDRYRTFDFLTIPQWLFNLMYSEKGYPNRYRVWEYERLFGEAGLDILQLEPSGEIEHEELEFIRPHLQPSFQKQSDDRIRWGSFWVHMRGAAS